MRSANLFDFHGTLVDVSGIRHLIKDRQYDSFYELSLSCPPIEETVAEARESHEDGFVNLLFTGLPERYVIGLNEWLTRNAVPIDLIELRGEGDFRKDFVLKRDMYLRAIDNGYYVLRAWEDSPRVIDLWRSQGIDVKVIPGWDETLTTRRVDKPLSPS